MLRELCVLLVACSACTLQAGQPLRQVIQLDGQWEVAEGGREEIPTRFDRSVPVPGFATGIGLGEASLLRTGWFSTEQM